MKRPRCLANVHWESIVPGNALKTGDCQPYPSLLTLNGTWFSLEDNGPVALHTQMPLSWLASTFLLTRRRFFRNFCHIYSSIAAKWRSLRKNRHFATIVRLSSIITE